MPAVWYDSRWCNWCMSEDKKKEREAFFINDRNYKDFGIVSSKMNTLINCKLLNGVVA